MIRYITLCLLCACSPTLDTAAPSDVGQVLTIGNDADPGDLDEDGDGIAARGDCDDTDPTIGHPQLWYIDADLDGYGRISGGEYGMYSCTRPPGHLATSGDCDDYDAETHPGAFELCDGIDNDCDGVLDYAESTDEDGDGASLCSDCDDHDRYRWNGNPWECGDCVDNDEDGLIDWEEAGCWDLTGHE